MRASPGSVVRISPQTAGKNPVISWPMGDFWHRAQAGAERLSISR
jgi:hypothetical protein